MSLARAFMHAGCPSIVTSLWEVNDEKMAKLIDGFYKNLIKKQDKHVALRNAKHHYLETEGSSFCHPFYWGGIIHVGNLDKVTAFEPKHTFARLIIGGCIMLVVFLFVFRWMK